MPIVALVTIVLAMVIAAVLATAVAVILVQLSRTSAVLDDVDGLLGSLPPALEGLGPALTRANRALAAVAASSRPPPPTRLPTRRRAPART
jgi:type II secretory pathway component PulJ